MIYYFFVRTISVINYLKCAFFKDRDAHLYDIKENAPQINLPKRRPLMGLSCYSCTPNSRVRYKYLIFSFAEHFSRLVSLISNKTVELIVALFEITIENSSRRLLFENKHILRKCWLFLD